MANDHNMVFANYPNCHFILYGFLLFSFNSFNWLYSCTGGICYLFVEDKMSILPYPRAMPFIFLKLNREYEPQAFVPTCDVNEKIDKELIDLLIMILTYSIYANHYSTFRMTCFIMSMSICSFA